MSFDYNSLVPAVCATLFMDTANIRLGRLASRPQMVPSEPLSLYKLQGRR